MTDPPPYRSRTRYPTCGVCEYQIQSISRQPWVKVRADGPTLGVHRRCAERVAREELALGELRFPPNVESAAACPSCSKVLGSLAGWTWVRVEQTGTVLALHSECAERLLVGSLGLRRLASEEEFDRVVGEVSA